jgi:hypothetical protein
MFVLIMLTFFAWSRERRPSAGMGWLETARRANLADRFAEGAAGAAGTAGAATGARPAPRIASVDDDDEQLAAYNAYLARINGPSGHDAESS